MLIFFLETRRNDTPSDPRHACEIHYLPSESESVASLHPHAGVVVALI